MDLALVGPCQSNQGPENKKPKIEGRTAILSMSRVVSVKIIQWENIIKGLQALSLYDSVSVRIKEEKKKSLRFLQGS